MIFGNINQTEDYQFLEEQIRRCFTYVREHNLAEYETGRHDIDGENLFVNIVEYMTTTPEERFWEAHREYLDIHVMLRGPEQIDVNFIENIRQKDYVPADDFLPLEGPKNGHVVLEAGDFLICYPHDAHRTAVKVTESKQIKKAIFKVRIEKDKVG